MGNLDKSQLEAELLLAQKEKLHAEIAVLKRTTPLTEGIKIFGSLVIGIGGAIVAIFGFQMAEIKAEKFKLEADKARLTKDALQRNIDTLQFQIKQNQNVLDRLTDGIKKAQTQPESGELLDTLQQLANAAAIDSRASIPSPKSTTNPIKSLNATIEELFAPKAAVRGGAYNQLMAHYADRAELVPSLLDYAKNHMNNENGIYNTLVVLSHLDYGKVPRDVVPNIRSFAERARVVGPKTSDRVDKLLLRLPE